LPFYQTLLNCDPIVLNFGIFIDALGLEMEWSNQEIFLREILFWWGIFFFFFFNLGTRLGGDKGVKNN
jgi:hypothetical protein